MIGGLAGGLGGGNKSKDAGPVSVTSIFSWLISGGPDYSVFKSGITTNYSSLEERAAISAYSREQRAKGGKASGAGRNRMAFQRRNEMARSIGSRYGAGTALMSRGSMIANPGSQGLGGLGDTTGSTRAYTRESYPLGAPSLAFLEKFGRWGPEGPRGNRGWEGTLIPPATPQSMTAPSRRYTKELIQTRETRKENWQKPFVQLSKHAYVPRLNQSLAHMFTRKGARVGAIRRVTRTIF